MTRTKRWVVERIGVLVAGLALTTSAVSAQSGLERVEELTRMGRSEEARAALLEWWDAEEAGASRREQQRALWLRGRLTVDPLQAELDFRRLAVLYPSGEFTPDAILRMAQSAFAQGDEEAARGFVASLVRDYPRSRARESAEAWLADAGPVPPAGDTPTPASGARAGVTGAATPAADPPSETPPQTAPAEERPAPGAAAAEAAAGGAEAAPGEPVMNYYVQLGAFAEEERALALADEVAAEGVDVRVVRVEGSRFTHVRVGRFAQRSAAVELLEALTAQGINAALVRDDRPESPIRN